MPAGTISVARRLAKVDLREPGDRRREAEDALWQHLSAIGAETDSVAWAADIEDGFERVQHSVLVAGDRVWEPSPGGSWNRFSLWHPDAPIAYPDRERQSRADPIGPPIVRVARASLGRRWRVHHTTRTHRRWRESYAAVPDPVSVYRLALAAADEDKIVRAGPPQREQIVIPEDFASEHRWKKADRTYRSARHRLPTLEPLVRAWSAGLCFFWVVEYRRWSQRRCVAVPRPVLHLDAGRLHRSDGPAVEWRSGTSYWFWEGLPVPRRVAAQGSERARLQVLARTRNLELRRLLLDRIGYERFLDIAGSELVAQDDFGKLWRCGLRIDNEPLHVVDVLNTTPEPDGSHRRYLLGFRRTAARPVRPSRGRSASTTNASTWSPKKAESLDRVRISLELGPQPSRPRKPDTPGSTLFAWRQLHGEAQLIQAEFSPHRSYVSKGDQAIVKAV
jgi:hypothetical protein